MHLLLAFTLQTRLSTQKMANRNNLHWRRKKTIAIVGAGIAGLTAAYELQKAGFKVTVFEANDYAGGRMSSLYSEGFTFDRGANFFVRSYKTIKHYIDEFGLNTTLKSVPGDHVVFRNHKFHSLALHNLKEIALSKSIGIWSKLLLGLFFLKHRNSQESHYFKDVGTIAHNLSIIPNCFLKDNAYSLAVKLIDKEVADYLIDSFVRTMHFHSSKEVTGGLLFLVTPMFFSDELSTVCCLSNGMQKLADAFKKQLNVNLRTPIQRIMPFKNYIIVKPKGKKSQNFDIVILATPAAKSLALLDPLTKEQKTVLKQVTYAQTINVSYKIPLHSLKNIQCAYIPYKENKTISEFTNEEKKGIFNGKFTLINIGLHEEASKKLMMLPNAEIFHKVKMEFNKICPSIELENFVLMRHKEAMPKFSYKHIMEVRRFLENGQGQNNVYFAGDWLNSPWAEGACFSGAKVAQMITEKYG